MDEKIIMMVIQTMLSKLFSDLLPELAVNKMSSLVKKYFEPFCRSKYVNFQVYFMNNFFKTNRW